MQRTKLTIYAETMTVEVENTKYTSIKKQEKRIKNIMKKGCYIKESEHTIYIPANKINQITVSLIGGEKND